MAHTQLLIGRDSHTNRAIRYCEIRVTLLIRLKQEDALILQAKAATQGLSPEQYALQVLERDIAPDWLRELWASAEANELDQMTTEEIDAEIADARRTRRG